MHAQADVSARETAFVLPPPIRGSDQMLRREGGAEVYGTGGSVAWHFVAKITRLRKCKRNANLLLWDKLAFVSDLSRVVGALLWHTCSPGLHTS